MLNDDKTHSAISDDAEGVSVTAHMSDSARAAVVDVVSLRGLVRAMNVLRKGPQSNAFDEALTRMINTNGSIAKAIEGDR